MDAAYESLVWRELHEVTIAGLGWEDLQQPFDRLPARAESFVTERVWEMSKHPVGVAAVFETNAAELGLRWTLEHPPVPGNRMNLLGWAGFDLYGEDENGTLAWVDARDPWGEPPGKEQHGWVTRNLDPGSRPGGFRRFRLYFPIGARVLSVQIGIPSDAEIHPAPDFTGGTIGYYGTSIVHGRSVSRPGMTHAAILQRRLQRPMWNLGFGGAAKMEEPLAHLLAELDPEVWLIDPVPNMDAVLIRQRARPFLDIIRKKHPETPILLIEDREHANARFFRERREKHASNRDAWREVYASMVAEGDRNVRYLGFDNLLGLDGEGTVDGSHPNDLGAWRYADAIEPVLRTILRASAKER